MSLCFSLANPLSSAGETIVINCLRSPKAVPMVITTLANRSTMFILSDGLHPRLNYMPIVKLIAQKISSHWKGSSGVSFEVILFVLSMSLLSFAPMFSLGNEKLSHADLILGVLSNCLINSTMLIN